MKTLKTEEVEGRPYRDLAHARGDIGAFIEEVYNKHRLHSALAYRSPLEFEETITAPLAAVRLYSSQGCQQAPVPSFLVSHQGCSPLDLGRITEQSVPAPRPTILAFERNWKEQKRRKVPLLGLRGLPPF